MLEKLDVILQVAFAIGKGFKLRHVYQKVYGDALLCCVKSWVQTVKSQRNSLDIFFIWGNFKNIHRKKEH